MDKNGNLERGDVCHICGDYRCGIEGNICEFLVKFNELIDLSKNERPQGEWARHDEWVGGEYVGGFYHVDCPCNDGYFVKWRMKYCGNCGAKMREVDDDI